MTDIQVKKKSDLKVRTLSAVVMIAVAGAALWLGGWIFSALVLAIFAGLFLEWRDLVNKITADPVRRFLWMLGGFVYIGIGLNLPLRLSFADAYLSQNAGNYLIPLLLPLIMAVIATDVGAYFSGRLIGGPKIAAKISPNKTWAGLLGGIVFSSVIFAWVSIYFAPEGTRPPGIFYVYLVAGSLLAVVAQAGDFFESWMKRRAGVKDSGQLIPGHGGLLDRLDGLVAVLFTYQLVLFAIKVLEYLRLGYWR